MPGDPVINLLGEDFIAGKEAVEKIREELGLNRPILVQYANYWKNLFQFDLGYSYHFRARVSSLIISRLKWTFILVAPSLILGTIIGALAGSLAGWKRKSKGNTFSFFFFYLFTALLLFLFLSYFSIFLDFDSVFSL